MASEVYIYFLAFFSLSPSIHAFSFSLRGLCVSFFRTDVELCIYHLFVCSNFNFMHNSQWITLSTESYRVIYSFCTNLLHSLIIWWMVSTPSPNKLHLLFCCVMSILALIWLVLIALFYAAIRRDYVSFLRFQFLSHSCVFSCEMLLISRLKRQKSRFSSHFCFTVIVRLSPCCHYCFWWL